MVVLLSNCVTSRDNNFNLIRFIAATLVLYSHSFALVFGTENAEPLRFSIGMTWGSIAVDVFFVTSGFLITGSYFSRNNIIAFVWARVLRIYPALIISVIFCVFIVGLYFTTLNTWEYLTDYQTLKFGLKNALLLYGVEYELPGVFSDIPWQETVNISLWTLPYELSMYFILAILLLGVSVVRKKYHFITFKNTLLVISVCSILINAYNHFYPVLPVNFIRLFSMFFIGATFYIWRDRIYISSKWFYILLSLLVMSTLNKDVFFIIYSLTLPYLLFYIVYIPSGKIRGFNILGDYSYGIYIYAFPIQQSTAALVKDVSTPIMILVSFSITLLLSVFSWHLVEKQLLKKKGSYVTIENFIQLIRPSKFYSK